MSRTHIYYDDGLPKWFAESWGEYVKAPKPIRINNHLRCAVCREYIATTQLYIPEVAKRTWNHYNKKHEELMALKVLES